MPQASYPLSAFHKSQFAYLNVILRMNGADAFYPYEIMLVRSANRLHKVFMVREKGEAKAAGT